MSQGGAYVHNLLAGRHPKSGPEGRKTPFHKPHSTEVAGLQNIPGGDDRFYNNIFIGHRAVCRRTTAAELPVLMAGNVFLMGAKPSKHEPDPLVQPKFDPGLKLVEKPDGMYLQDHARQIMGTSNGVRWSRPNCSVRRRFPTRALRTARRLTLPHRHRLLRQQAKHRQSLPGPL